MPQVDQRTDQLRPLADHFPKELYGGLAAPQSRIALPKLVVGGTHRIIQVDGFLEMRRRRREVAVDTGSQPFVVIAVRCLTAKGHRSLGTPTMAF